MNANDTVKQNHRDTSLRSGLNRASLLRSSRTCNMSSFDRGRRSATHRPQAQPQQRLQLLKTSSLRQMSIQIAPVRQARQASAHQRLLEANNTPSTAKKPDKSTALSSKAPRCKNSKPADAHQKRHERVQRLKNLKKSGAIK